MTNKHSAFVTYIGRPLRPEEPDLLLGYEAMTLIAKIMDDEVINTISIESPEGGWSHDQIELICSKPFAVESATHTVDLYLWDRFVGSTEI